MDILGSLGISMTHVSAEEDPTPLLLRPNKEPLHLVQTLQGLGWHTHRSQRSPSQESSRAWDSPEHLGLVLLLWSPTDQRSPSQESSRAWDSPEHLGLMEQRWLWLTHPQQTELSQLTFPEAGEVSRKETQ